MRDIATKTTMRVTPSFVAPTRIKPRQTTMTTAMVVGVGGLISPKAGNMGLASLYRD